LIELGRVGGNELEVTIGGQTLAWDVDELFDSWYFSIERALA
jgi:hypothetical protein